MIAPTPDAVVAPVDAGSNLGAGKDTVQESGNEMTRHSGEEHAPRDLDRGDFGGRKVDQVEVLSQSSVRDAGDFGGKNKSSLIDDDEMQRQATWEAIHESRCVEISFVRV